jgi:hypothetical protein
VDAAVKSENGWIFWFGLRPLKALRLRSVAVIGQLVGMAAEELENILRHGFWKGKGGGAGLSARLCSILIWIFAELFARLMHNPFQVGSYRGRDGFEFSDGSTVMTEHYEPIGMDEARRHGIGPYPIFVVGV